MTELPHASDKVVRVFLDDFHAFLHAKRNWLPFKDFEGKLSETGTF